MLKLIKKLAMVSLPIIIYFAIFIYFEPYNYFGLKESEYSGDSRMYRVREYNKNPSDVIILGDSKLAHFDMDKVNRLVGRPVGQLSFGGASINESMDLLEFAMEKNPNLHTVYFGASFYTLNESYYKDRMSSIETTATNPFAYMLNFNYNVEMLNEIKYFLKGEKNLATPHHRDWTEEDYLFEDGSPRPYRKNLMEYADTIAGVCKNYVYDVKDVERYTELARLCNEKGIKLYTVMPPMDDSLKELVVVPMGIDKHINDFIDKVSPYSEVINFELNEVNVFGEDLFFDGFHLDDYTGLPMFTEMLFGSAK